MANFLHILSVEVTNFKNIKYGQVEFPKKKAIDCKNILGIYGQNGSGKTALVQALEFVQDLISSETPSANFDSVIKNGENSMGIQMSFLMQNEMKIYQCTYKMKVEKSEKGKIYLSEEQVTYRRQIELEKERGYTPEIMRSFTYILTCNLRDEKEIFRSSTSRKKDVFEILNIENISVEKGLDLIVEKKESYKRGTTFIFNEAWKDFISEEFSDIIYKFKAKIQRKTRIVSNTEFGLIYTNFLLPLSFYLEDASNQRVTYGTLPVLSHKNQTPVEDKVFLMSNKEFELATATFKQINQVLPALIPGLTLTLLKLSDSIKKEDKVSFITYLIADKNGNQIPFYYESEGIKRIVSILSLLVAVYNDPDMFIVIDELDAGVYEFLLGDIIQLLNEHGKGQLLFTSHNLRLLEVLDVDNFAFSTTNESQRFIKLKDIKQTNNLRSVYIRAIQLGGQEEKMYEKVSTFKMRKAFERAGREKYEEKEANTSQ